MNHELISSLLRTVINFAYYNNRAYMKIVLARLSVILQHIKTKICIPIWIFILKGVLLFILGWSFIKTHVFTPFWIKMKLTLIPIWNNITVFFIRFFFTIQQLLIKWLSLPWTSKKFKIIIVSVIGIIIFIGLNIAVFNYAKKTGKKLAHNNISVPIPTPTPTPYPFNVHGKIEFTITYGKKEGPKFTECFIDPFDAKIGKAQTFSLNVSSATPVSSMSATWKTDTKEREIPMTLKEGTKTKGRWEAVWNVDDTILYRLYLIAKASDDKTTNVYELSLR